MFGETGFEDSDIIDKHEYMVRSKAVSEEEYNSYMEKLIPEDVVELEWYEITDENIGRYIK